MKYTFALFLLLLPVLVFADNHLEFTPLVGIPGILPGQEVTLNSLINTLYALSISIAALLAVIKIVIAGVKYMVTDIVTSKGEAKEDIKSALIGLLVVLGAVLILTVINPDLAKVNISLDTVGVASQTTTPTTTTLDTSLVRSVSLGGGSSVESFPFGSTPEMNQQRNLFRAACISPNYLLGVGGGTQCIHRSATTRDIVSIGAIENTRISCTSGGGTYGVDPVVTNMAWCSYPIQ